MEDPTGKGDEIFKSTIRMIEEKIMDLKNRLILWEKEYDEIIE